MPEIVLTLGQQGRPEGVTQDDAYAYALFKKRIRSLQPGQTIRFAWSEARAPKVHAAYFKALQVIFENQDRYTSMPEFREWVERGARHVEVFTAGGVEFERVKSIRHEELDDDAFRILFSRAKAYLLSAKALVHLWPHAKLGDAYAGAQALLEGISR
jgi:hypothetical protein